MKILKKKTNKNKTDIHVIITYGLFFTVVIFAFLHSFFYNLLGIPEAFFFSFTVLAIMGFFMSLMYNVFIYIIKGQPADIWKLGWIGLFGMFGFIFGPGFFGLFGFFGFFGTKN